MSFTTALVDRARVLRLSPTATKVEGTSIFQSVTGPWFKARLIERQSTDTLAQGGQPKAVKAPELLYSLRAGDGTEVVVNVDEKVEIESPDTFDGRRVYQVNGQPEILRRRKGVVGGYAALRRIEEPGR